VLGALLQDAPAGAVIDIWLDPTRGDRSRLCATLPSGADPREIFCEVTADLAGRRYAERVRHGAHRGADADLLRRIETAAGLLAVDGAAAPSGLGPVLRVDTSQEVVIADLARWLSDPARRAG
jgi:hypothetical protein